MAERKAWVVAMGIYCKVVSLSPTDFEHFVRDQESLVIERDADGASERSAEIGKGWHGLHYLLTGTADEGAGPLAFILAGGQNLGDDSEPIRYFAPAETSEINRALVAVSDDVLWSRFDPEAMEAKDIYPGIWDEDEEDLKEEYLDYFGQLKKLVAAAAAEGHGLLVTIG